MRISEIKIPKPIRWIGLALISPAILIVAAAAFVAFAIAYPVHLKRKYISPRTGWKRWFAWHPVPLLDPQWPHRNSFLEWVWLETVEREYPWNFSKLRYVRPSEREQLEASRQRWREHEEKRQAEFAAAFAPPPGNPQMSAENASNLWKKVSHEEFEMWRKDYPNYLTRDVAMMCEPPMISWNDFTIAAKWPDSMVARTIYGSGVYEILIKACLETCATKFPSPEV